MRIVAVASAGGHWIELLRLRPLFEEHQVTYMSTNPDFAKMVPGAPFYTVPEASRWNKLRVLYSAYQMFKIMRTIRPDVVISTGAAPGVMGLLVGKLLGCKTVWIDSICNIEHISMSGRFAARFCDRVYTQWPERATKPFLYHGSLLA
jgi:UDP-N-acetylglucosamine:LPS N-acetylglucosamine transferase